MYTRRMALSRTAYFQRLGIDVWVRRAPKPVDAGQRAASPARSERPASASVAVPAPTAARKSDFQPAVSPKAPRDRAGAPGEPAASAAFRIQCFRYGRVFVAIDEEAWPRRRFLHGVALALNGFASAEREDIVFAWPQPGVDAQGGGRSFRAFFGHQTRSGEYTVLSGARVPALLGKEAPSETCLLDGHLYVSPRAADATAKQALWQLIQRRR